MGPLPWSGCPRQALPSGQACVPVPVPVPGRLSPGPLGCVLAAGSASCSGSPSAACTRPPEPGAGKDDHNTEYSTKRTEEYIMSYPSPCIAVPPPSVPLLTTTNESKY